MVDKEAYGTLNEHKEILMDTDKELILDYLNKHSYKITEVYESENAGVLLTNKFDSIEKYLSTSKAASQYGSEIEYTEKDGYITLKIKGRLGQETQEQTDQLVIEEATINISLPNRKVKSHNADSIDEETDTYTWKVNNIDEKELTITFAKDANKYFPLVEIIAIVAFVVIFTKMLFSLQTSKISFKFGCNKGSPFTCKHTIFV